MLALETEFALEDFRLLAISMGDSSGQGWLTEFKTRHFPALISFINAEPDMDSLCSVIDPTWSETIPISDILGRGGQLVQKSQGKKLKAHFSTVN